MSVTVTLHPYLNEGGGEAKVDLGGSTVRECLKELVGRFPAMQAKLFAKPDKLHGYIEILVNGRPTMPLELAYPLKDGDDMAILVFLSGG